MKIGLVRHFKVDAEYIHGDITAKEFTNWMQAYDDIEVIPIDVDLGDVNWNRCYASDLYRAKVTARNIFDGEINVSPLVREVDLTFKEKFYNNIDRKVPFTEWSIYAMNSWARNSSVMSETMDESKYRVNEFLRHLFSEIDIEDNVLIVCHGMIMTVLDAELKNRGFKGDTVVAAKNGELFSYERN